VTDIDERGMMFGMAPHYDYPPDKMPNIYDTLVVKYRDTVNQQIDMTCKMACELLELKRPQ